MGGSRWQAQQTLRPSVLGKKTSKRADQPSRSVDFLPTVNKANVGGSCLPLGLGALRLDQTPPTPQVWRIQGQAMFLPFLQLSGSLSSQGAAFPHGLSLPLTCLSWQDPLGEPMFTWRMGEALAPLRGMRFSLKCCPRSNRTSPG